jgi:hypothetical protein
MSLLEVDVDGLGKQLASVEAELRAYEAEAEPPHGKIASLV